MKLYEINQAIEEAIANAVNEETGEIEDLSILEELQIMREEKIEGIILMTKNLDAEAVAIRQEERNLADRRQAMERKSERIKEYLKFVLAGEKFSTSKCSVSYRKSQQVSITNEANLPAEFWRIKQEPDKAGIKEALKAGRTVEGAELVTNLSMTIK